MVNERILSYGDAIKEATVQSMQHDPKIVLLGIDVADPKGIFNTTKDLAKEFGSDRVFSTPLAEEGMLGVAIGMALAGLRPINIHIRTDFLMVCMNQIVNHLAKYRYMFGNQCSCPVIVRSIIGRSWGQGSQHSQSFFSTFTHIPGLQVFAPVLPYDAKAVYQYALTLQDPSIIFEHRMSYYQRGPVPEGPCEFKPSRILREGKDITLLGTSFMAIECLRAAKYLEEQGINAQVVNVIDLKTNLDRVFYEQTVSEDILIVDNDWLFSGWSAEVVAQWHKLTQGKLYTFERMGYAPCPCPTTPALEKIFYPTAESIASRAYFMLTKKNWIPTKRTEPWPEESFKGPF